MDLLVSLEAPEIPCWTVSEAELAAFLRWLLAWTVGEGEVQLSVLDGVHFEVGFD
jgi:hypothetical protein